MIYGERTLQADADNFGVMLTMAGALAQQTREFDLDKEEKLTRAEDYVNKALGILDTAPRPNPNVTDSQWEVAKNDYRSEAHGALALAAMAREELEDAIAEFRTAVEIGSTRNPNIELMLAKGLTDAGKHDEAITVLDSLLADAQVAPQIHKLAEQQRLYTLQEKEKQE